MNRVRLDYVAAGQLHRIDEPAAVQSYDCDANGRLHGLRTAHRSGPRLTQLWQYDSFGRPTAYTLWAY